MSAFKQRKVKKNYSLVYRVFTKLVFIKPGLIALTLIGAKEDASDFVNVINAPLDAA